MNVKIYIAFFEMMCKYYYLIVCIGLLCFACNSPRQNLQVEGDLVRMRQLLIGRTLNADNPVILLEGKLTSDEQMAQSIFIQDKEVQQFYKDPVHGGKLLNEIFSVSNIRSSDITEATKSCNKENCKRVELYNYALNATVVGIVDVKQKKLRHLASYKETQPDVPPHLVELAMYIAQHDSMVIKEYGEDYRQQKALMPGTKTALNRTKCQRSKHLCLAPTFIKGEKALWAIVDLTDLNVAGLRWTHVGATGMAVTERSMQNAKIMELYCDKENEVEKDRWRFTFTMTRSDGLQLSDVSFDGKKLFNQVKLVDWHVSYSKTEGFGDSDAIGCPEFSTAAVLAVEPPYIEPIISNGDTLGFLLGQRYYSEGWPTPCNYNYHQYYEFYKDGRFRPVAGSIGRGCGNNGIYRPVMRISLAGDAMNVFEFTNGHWEQWKKEGWSLQSEQQIFEGDHHWFKFQDKKGKGLLLMANTGQMRDGGRGDHAYVYLSKHWPKRDEGDIDMPTIGPCCNQDHQQGPEKFINDESVQNTEMVLWYVAQVQNDDTKGKEYCWAESVLKNGVYVPIIYPCYMGPMFKLY